MIRKARTKIYYRRQSNVREYQK